MRRTMNPGTKVWRWARCNERVTGDRGGQPEGPAKGGALHSVMGVVFPRIIDNQLRAKKPDLTRRHLVIRKLGAAVTPLLLATGFVVAFQPQIASAAQNTTTPRLTVCSKGPAGYSSFSLNGGKSFGLKAGQCSVNRLARVGLNKVTETRAASSSELKSISVSPSRTVVNSSIKTATVSLKLAARASATVGYTNAKVQTAGTGYIELCKYGEDRWTQGDFTFTISGVAAPVTVLAGTCAAPVAVPAGSVTIHETEPANFNLAGVTTVPSTALSSVNLSAATATVTVPTGVNVETSFYNEAALGVVKVCKTLAANAAALEGDTFVFDVSWSFTPPSPSAPISGSGTVAVTAAMATGVTVCEPFSTLLPVGTAVSITEDMAASPANTSPTVTGIIPPSANNGSTSTTANLIVAQGATDALFTDGALGYIEVCKNPVETFGQDNTVGAQPFSFSVDGGPAFTVTAGSCSAPMQVAVGNHTVQESLSNDFYFVSVSTVAADDPSGARLLSGATMNPATVSVPYGGVGNETVVTFTNHTQGSQIKVCVEQTSPDANLGGATFDVTGTTSNGVSISSVLTLSPSTSNPTGLICGSLTPIFDAINGSGNNPVTFSLTESAGPGVPAGTDIANVIYQGNGSGPSPDSFPQALGTSFSFTAGMGENVVTFVNGRTASGTDSLRPSA